MKKLNITKREISFFFIGIFTMLIIETLTDWNSSKESFKKGWNATKGEIKK